MEDDFSQPALMIRRSQIAPQHANTKVNELTRKIPSAQTHAGGGQGSKELQGEQTPLNSEGLK